MGIVRHDNLVQGSPEWLQARCGLITASEVKLLLTPTLKPADNEKTRAHLYELLAQRITGHVEPVFVTDDMLRGHEDEILARQLYHDRYSPVTEAGFITNDCWGFTLGYSPDGLVGDDGLIEIKSRRAKFQVQTILDNVDSDTVPADYLFQVQTGLLVTERKWLDFISYSGGLPMATIRIYPLPEVQDAILAAAARAEGTLAAMQKRYEILLASKARLIPTERTIEQEMFLS